MEDELLKSEARFKELSRTDPLTGLANRRVLSEAAEQEFQRSKRFGSSAALLMIDIDYFKNINDTYGHDMGDAVLVSLANTLKTQARTNDLAVRLGGEEFVILLIETDIKGAMDLAERMRVAASRIILPSSLGYFNITISVGVALFNKDDTEWSETLSRADEAMYSAKQSGRNRVKAA